MYRICSTSSRRKHNIGNFTAVAKGQDELLGFRVLRKLRVCDLIDRDLFEPERVLVGLVDLLPRALSQARQFIEQRNVIVRFAFSKIDQVAEAEDRVP